MIRTSVMTSLEGRSIAFVNLFLFTIYFTYIIIGIALNLQVDTSRKGQIIPVQARNKHEKAVLYLCGQRNHTKRKFVKNFRIITQNFMNCKNMSLKVTLVCKFIFAQQTFLLIDYFSKPQAVLSYCEQKAKQLLKFSFGSLLIKKLYDSS